MNSLPITEESRHKKLWVTYTGNDIYGCVKTLPDEVTIIDVDPDENKIWMEYHGYDFDEFMESLPPELKVDVIDESKKSGKIIKKNDLKNIIKEIVRERLNEVDAHKNLRMEEMGNSAMTYEEKVQSVINHLDSDGADSEREWAENILRGIGITPETP